MNRAYTCKMCDKTYETGMRGQIPEVCPDCRDAYRHNKYLGRYEGRYYIPHPRPCQPRNDTTYIKGALEKAGNKCERCGITGIRLHVHHKDGSGETLIPNNFPDNLIVVCSKCHKILHAGTNLVLRDKINHLRDERKLTFAVIGESVGLSRQRVHQLYNSKEPNPLK
jgi:hypothetical protein